MTRLFTIPFVSLGLLGCNQSPPAVPDVAVVAAQQADAKPADAAQTPVVQPKKDEPPPVFPFPNDAAGKALPKVVSPPSPPLPATEKFGTAPKVRTAPNKLVEPEPLSKMLYSPPPLLPAKPAGVRPTSPTERVPLDLGFGASKVPAKPLLPDSPGIAIKARDAKLPPDLAPLARQLPDRASLDDPTAEPGNLIIVSRTPMLVLGLAGFLKSVLPDPFEFADQVKPRVLPTAEPRLAPVPINPQRTK